MARKKQSIFQREEAILQAWQAIWDLMDEYSEDTTDKDTFAEFPFPSWWPGKQTGQYTEYIAWEPRRRSLVKAWDRVLELLSQPWKTLLRSGKKGAARRELLDALIVRDHIAEALFYKAWQEASRGGQETVLRDLFNESLVTASEQASNASSRAEKSGAQSLQEGWEAIQTLLKECSSLESLGWFERFLNSISVRQRWNRSEVIRSSFPQAWRSIFRHLESRCAEGLKTKTSERQGSRGLSGVAKDWEVVKDWEQVIASQYFLVWRAAVDARYAGLEIFYHKGWAQAVKSRDAELIAASSIPKALQSLAMVESNKDYFFSQSELEGILRILQAFEEQQSPESEQAE